MRSVHKLQVDSALGFFDRSQYLCPPFVVIEALLVQKWGKMWDKHSCHSLKRARLSTVELSALSCPSKAPIKCKHICLIDFIYIRADKVCIIRN